MEIGDRYLIKSKPVYWSDESGGKNRMNIEYPTKVTVCSKFYSENGGYWIFTDELGGGWAISDTNKESFELLSKEEKTMNISVTNKDSFGLLPKEEKNMIIYKTKEILNRTVTVCVKVASNIVVTAGYSVTHPDDDFDKEIAKKISLGRASKDKTNVLEPMFLGEGMEKKYILFAIADAVFRDIENKKITIKGIRV